MIWYIGAIYLLGCSFVVLSERRKTFDATDKALDALLWPIWLPIQGLMFVVKIIQVKGIK